MARLPSPIAREKFPVAFCRYSKLYWRTWGLTRSHCPPHWSRSLTFSVSAENAGGAGFLNPAGLETCLLALSSWNGLLPLCSREPSRDSLRMTRELRCCQAAIL